MRTNRRRAARALAWLSCIGLCAAAHAGDRIKFSIEAGPALETLKAFCQQANLLYSIDPAKFDDASTRAVHGGMSVDRALRTLLKNTGITFALSADHTKVSFDRPLSSGNPASTVPKHRSGKSGAAERETMVQPDELQGSEESELSSVTVTGTLFHQKWYPVGTRILNFDASEVVSSGYSSAGEFLRSLPQTFGSGPTPDTHLGVEAGANTGMGTGVNLRGLGARATLLLVNGKRPAPSGSAGSFTDISNIPLVSIERIELLPDSAAATYGSDAVGGVVNIITRDGNEPPVTFAQWNSVGRGSEHTGTFYQTLTDQWGSGNIIFGFGASHQSPLSAMDRAFYTADLRYGGGPNLNLLESFPPTISSFDGTKNWALTTANTPHPRPSDFFPGSANLTNRYQDAQIIASQDNLNAYTKLFHQVGDAFSISLEGFANRRRAAEVTSPQQIDLALSPGSPYYVDLQGDGSPLLLRTNIVRLLGPQSVVSVVTSYHVSLDFVTAIGEEGLLTVSGHRGKERAVQLTVNSADMDALEQGVQTPNPNVDFNPYDQGLDRSPALLAAIRGRRRFDSLSQLDSVSLSFEDKITSWPGDPLQWALGAELREQLLTNQLVDDNGSIFSGTRYTRQVVAGFAEVTVPLIRKDTSLGRSRLDASVSVRQDDYSDFGAARTPRGGLQWTLGKRLTIRGSYGHSFRAPDPGNLDQSGNSLLSLPLPDARSPTAQSTALIEAGNNSGVKHERGTEKTLGINANLPFTSQTTLEFAVDYFSLSLKGRIESTPYSDQLLNDPRYASIVARNPTSALLQAACATGRYLASGASCLTSDPASIIDLRLRNLSSLQTRGIDFDTGVKWDAAWGTFRWQTNGTYLLGYSQTALPGAPEVSLLNTDHNPINLRFRTSLDWSLGRVDALVAANYANRYRDVDSSPVRWIGSFMTFDWLFKYTLAERKSSGAVEVSAGVQNFLNRQPPFLRNVAGAVGYDQENADPQGRVWFVNLSYRL